MNIIKKAITSPRKVFLYILRYTKLFHGLNDKTYLKLVYWLSFNRRLNLDSPRLFSEKIQWLKLHDRNPDYTVMADKFEAKHYVAEKIGEGYIIPSLKVYKDVSEIRLEDLPQQFVLKPTHDSSGLVICRDRAKFDFEKAKELLSQSLRNNYYYVEREWQYKNIPPRIIAEEYIENDEKEGLHDYKVWCFNGRPTYVQYISGRVGTETVEGFYDWDWNLQPFSYHNPLMKDLAPRPARLEELYELAEKLSAGIPFCRVDFYILSDGSIRFGEITFYPIGGMERWHPDEMDLIFGNMIDLPVT